MSIALNKDLEVPYGPETVMISPTDRCNLNCEMCWRQEKGENEEFAAGMDLNLIKAVINSCRDLKVEKIDFTGGGEPFLRNDIFDMLQTASDLTTTLTTNGTLLNETKIKQLLSAEVDEICFSIDSPQQETNDLLRGKGVWQRSINSIKALKKLKKKREVEKPRLTISTVINRRNLSQLPALVDFASELKVEGVNFSPLNVWDSNRHLTVKKKPDKVEQILKRAQERARENEVDSNLQTLIEYGLSEHEPPDFCFAPWEMLFINASGEVMVCCTLATFHQNIIGNIQDKSLEELWNCDKMRQFRQRMNRREFFEDCKHCLPDFTKRYNQKLERIKS